MGSSISNDKSIVIKINYKLYNTYTKKVIKTDKKIVDKFIKSKKWKIMMNYLFYFKVISVKATTSTITIIGYVKNKEDSKKTIHISTLSDLKLWVPEVFGKALNGGDSLKQINKNVYIEWDPKKDMTIEYSKNSIDKSIGKNIKKSLPNKSIKIRPSPSNSATLLNVGTRKKGNDKNIWIVSITKSGVKKWKKVIN